MRNVRYRVHLSHTLKDFVSSQVPIVKIEDADEAAAYGLKTLPALVLFDNGVPERYPGFDLTKTAEIKQWIMDEILYDDIDVIEVGKICLLCRECQAGRLVKCF